MRAAHSKLQFDSCLRGLCPKGLLELGEMFKIIIRAIAVYVGNIVS